MMTELIWIKCITCKSWKEEEYFYKYKKTCKKCHIQMVVKSRKKHKEKYNEYSKKYSKKYITPEKRKILNQKARIKYHEKKALKMVVSV